MMGEVYTVEQLLYALMLQSANDAALALAEAVSGWSTLAAIRSALIATLPLMFLGSLAELLPILPRQTAFRTANITLRCPIWQKLPAKR